MKKIYVSPVVSKITVNSGDIMTGSDVIVDVGVLFSEEEL